MAKGDELQRVGRAVAARRGELGMTQQELADKAHVDLKTIYNLESGARWPIARTRAAISAALNWGGDGLTVIAGGADPAPRRFSLPEPTPEMARDLDPILAEVGACAMVAAAAYPGQRLSGRQVFPDSPAAPSYWPAARVFWDAAAGEGVKQEDIPEAVATLVTWKIQRDRKQQQDGSAAGLGHRPAVRALL